MRTSEYYDLTLVEGSDLVNPLTQDVPNYEKIDEQMFLNSIATVGQAVELKSGTVHAITRENPDASMFRFTATSRYDEGDTFTVDGVQVSGLLTDGTTLADGAYAINANVLCCLTGTVLTLYTVPGAIQTAQNALKLGGQLPEYYGKASDVEQATLVAQASGTLANQVNSNLNDLANLNYTETSISAGTTTKELLQLLMNKVFPKAVTCYRFTTDGYDSKAYCRIAKGLLYDDGTFVEETSTKYDENTYPRTFGDGNVNLSYGSAAWTITTAKTCRTASSGSTMLEITGIGVSTRIGYSTPAATSAFYVANA